MSIDSDPTVTGTGAGAVKAGDASGGANAEMKQEIQRIVMGIFKEAVPRLVTQAVQQSIPSILEKIAGDAASGSQDDVPVGNVAADPEKQTQKATLKQLQSQIETLTKGIDAERKARTKAEQDSIATQTRAEVQAHFAKYLGADSPHLRPYVNEYLSQFQHSDGGVVRKIKDEYGNEQFLSADKAVEELFKTELKHLQPNKAAQLPPNALRGFGQPLAQQQSGNGAPQRINPLLATIAEGIMDTRPEAAQILVNDSAKLAAPNGSRK